MPSYFEAVLASSISNEVGKTDDSPSSAGSYGNRHFYFLKKPATTKTFKAKNMTLAECQAIDTAAAVRPPTYTLTDKLGTSYTGYIVSWSYENLDGTLYCEGTLQLEIYA